MCLFCCFMARHAWLTQCVPPSICGSTCRQLSSAAEMKCFLLAVLGHAPAAVQPGFMPAAAAGASPFTGSLKRKQREAERVLPQPQQPEQQQQQQQQEHQLRCYFRGPSLQPSQPSCAPLVILATSQPGIGGTALYLCQSQLAPEYARCMRRSTESFRLFMRRVSWDKADEPRAFMPVRCLSAPVTPAPLLARLRSCTEQPHWCCWAGTTYHTPHP